MLSGSVGFLDGNAVGFAGVVGIAVGIEEGFFVGTRDEFCTVGNLVGEVEGADDGNVLTDGEEVGISVALCFPVRLLVNSVRSKQSASVRPWPAIRSFIDFLSRGISC